MGRTAARARRRRSPRARTRRRREGWGAAGASNPCAYVKRRIGRGRGRSSKSGACEPPVDGAVAGVGVVVLPAQSPQALALPLLG